MKKVSRNAPCPCGSGEKYKNCHGKRPNQMVATIAIFGVVLIGGGLLLNYYSSSTANGPINLGQTNGQPVPQPEGEAPPGKVWSPEHGHWHDAPGGTATPTLPEGTPALGGTPQPDGPAPEGKVWSAEHGHWHDASGAEDIPSATQQAGGIPQPDGPVPEGKVWSPEHGHWHDIAQQQQAPAPPTGPGPPYPQPEGPVPEGKIWNADHGHWHDWSPPPPETPVKKKN